MPQYWIWLTVDFVGVVGADLGNLVVDRHVNASLKAATRHVRTLQLIGIHTKRTGHMGEP